MVRKFAAEAGRDVKAFPIVPSRWTGSPRRSLRSGREPGEEASADWPVPSRGYNRVWRWTVTADE